MIDNTANNKTDSPVRFEEGLVSKQLAFAQGQTHSAERLFESSELSF